MEALHKIDKSIKVANSPDGMHETCALEFKVGPLNFYLSVAEATDLSYKLLNVLSERTERLGVA
jgi:hypothetical protein